MTDRANAKKFLKKYKVNSLELHDLKRIIESQGFTIIEFDSYDNTDDVQNIIDTLKIKSYTQQSRAFTYADNDSRLVFVNEDLSDDEKLIVLAHEEGHIFCEHFDKRNIIGHDVLQEHEANEFAFFITHDTHLRKAGRFLAKYKKVVITTICLLIIIGLGVGVSSYINKQNSYYGDFYVTATGTKYHRKDCIYIKYKTDISRLTKDEFESGNYDPCKACLPDDR